MTNTEIVYPEIEYTPEQKRALGQVYRQLIACARKQSEISTQDMCEKQKMDSKLINLADDSNSPAVVQ